ncbi:MAG: GspH/FimT family pseudopilin [Gammaproteobacteria bacterium]|jgi:type IV fimbrial biogenesis protein FimT
MPRCRGFTLLELVYTLLIATILVTVALPAWGRLEQRTARATTLNALVGALRLARAESVHRDRAVAICPSADGSHCRARRKWAKGWIIFVNSDRDYPVRRDAGEPILRRHGPITVPASMPANRGAFTFRPLGSRSTNGTIAWCPPHSSGVTPRWLVVSPTGRARLVRQRSGTSMPACAR